MQAPTLNLTQRERVEVLRKRMEMTQDELSNAAGYSQSYGSHVQRGRVESPEALDKMERVLTAPTQAQDAGVEA